ncbi:MAG: hypothetical protein RL226_1310 [Bacteroidota bacterium]
MWSKKAIISIFFLSLLAPGAVFYLAVRIERKIIRKQVKAMLIEGVSDEQLVRFDFSHEECEALHWKHEKEFEYNGSMFDIVRREVVKDRHILICWPDKEESLLNQKLRMLTDFGMEKNSPRKKRRYAVFEMFKLLLYTKENQDHPYALLLHFRLPTLVTNEHQKWIVEVPTPPPLNYR